MESIEKTIEEGMDFIKLFHLPIEREDYFLHKNQIDLLIREVKEEYIEQLNQWKFEIKHIFPSTGEISIASSGLQEKILAELFKIIIEGEQDAVLSIFGKETFSFHTKSFSRSIDECLFIALGSPNRREVLEKLCKSSLDVKSKLLIGAMMAPYVSLLHYMEFFLSGKLTSPTMDTCNGLIDYAISLENNPFSYQKLSVMCNAVLAGATIDSFSKIDSYIQESIDENGTYDEVFVMKRVNEYFRLQNHQEKVKHQ